MDFFCEKYGWTPEEYYNQNKETLDLLKIINNAKIKKEQLDQKRNEFKNKYGTK